MTVFASGLLFLGLVFGFPQLSELQQSVRIPDSSVASPVPQVSKLLPLSLL